MLDMNGNRLYEGDIVELKFPHIRKSCQIVKISASGWVTVWIESTVFLEVTPADVILIEHKHDNIGWDWFNTDPQGVA